MKAGLGAVERWSQRHRSVRVARGTISSFLEHEALQYAGSMAYFGVLSIFQLLVLGVVVLSVVVGEGQARTIVIDQVRTATPLDTATIGAVIDGVIKARGDMTVVGLAFRGVFHRSPPGSQTETHRDRFATPTMITLAALRADRIALLPGESKGRRKDVHPSFRRSPWPASRPVDEAGRAW